MLHPSLHKAFRQAPSCRNDLTQSLTRLSISGSPIIPRTRPHPVTFLKTTIRHATHKSEGRANGAKNGPGKRLGAKKTGGQYVIPGNILYRQRGTLWFPGENVGLGRDHTLYATAPGYVTYYRDPARHKKRQYIGVVLKKEHTLPVQAGVARRRRLGMYAQRMGGEDQERGEDGGGGGEGGDGQPPDISRQMAGDQLLGVKEIKRGLPEPTSTSGRLGGPQRMQNWRLGKTLDDAQQAIRPYRSGERFLAWRKRKLGRARAAEKRGMKNARKQRKR